MAWSAGLERFQAKWRPVRVKKTRQIKNLEPRFDSIETEKALGLRFGRTGVNLATRVSHRGLNRNRKELTMIIFVGGKPKASKKAAKKAAKASAKKKPTPSKKPSKAKLR